MFTSNNNSENPISNPLLLPKNSPFSENTSGLKLEEDDLPWFLHFPSPFLDDNELLLTPTIIPQQQKQNQSRSPSYSKGGSSLSKEKKSTAGDGEQLKRRRSSGKKDRHSKIYTAQGFRDRRMRLSLQIARRFFDLQDMLGFDKASKTIEWLISKSKKAISELTGSLPQIKNTASGCEAASAARIEENAKGKGNTVKGKQPKCRNLVIVNNGENLSRKKSRKLAYSPCARESRAKARARARERTMEKMKIRDLERSKENPNCSLDQLGLGLEKSGHNNQEMKSSSSLEGNYSIEHQMGNMDIIETSRTSSSMFEYRNWDIDNAARINSNICANSPMEAGNIDVQKNLDSIFMATSNIHYPSRYAP